jgi:WD40 repeat protein
LSLLGLADPRHPTVIARITPPSGAALYEATFSPDGRTLAVASGDQHTYLYDIGEPASPKLVSSLGGLDGEAYSVAFDSIGGILAIGSADSAIYLWDVSDPRHPVHQGKLFGPIGYIYAVAFVPGHPILAASGNEDGDIWMWNIADPKHPAHSATLSSSANGVFSLAFSPDGRTLASGGIDHAVQFWDYDVAAARSWICSVVGEPITPGQWAQYVPGLKFRPVCPGR